MEQEETNWEEDGCLCSSCLRFFDPADVLLIWSAGVGMGGMDAPGCRAVVGGGEKYICRACSEQNRREFEEQERRRMVARERGRSSGV